MKKAVMPLGYVGCVQIRSYDGLPVLFLTRNFSIVYPKIWDFWEKFFLMSGAQNSSIGLDD